MIDTTNKRLRDGATSATATAPVATSPSTSTTPAPVNPAEPPSEPVTKP